MKRRSKKYFNLQKKIEHLIINFLLKEKRLTKQQLFEKLALPESLTSLYETVLENLLKEKKIDMREEMIVLKEKKKYVIEGILKTHPRGFGFVQPQDGSCEIFIPPKYLSSAINGDIVEVEIDQEHISPKGLEGKITDILQRKRENLGGTIYAKSANGYLVFSPLLGETKKIILHTKKGLQVGDRILMKITKYEEDFLTCDFVHKIGNIADASIDVDAAIADFQLRFPFPEDVLLEVKQLKKEIFKENRKDLTEHLTFTIDPQTAKDFDDALSLSTDPKGNYRLIVHIADVAHFVKSGSALDKEAYKRGNSVYFPKYCVPMLPEILSNDLCSLRANGSRYCVSVQMDFDARGDLIDYEIFRSIIKCQKNFTYQEALTILSQENSPFYSILNQMKKLALLFQEKRIKRGSIRFSLPEVRLIIDDEGNPTKISIHEYNVCHQIVEEFMLKTNEIIAIHLNKQEKMAIYRIHEEPSSEDLHDFYELVRAYGYNLPKLPTMQDIQNLFEKAKQSPLSDQLFTLYIRSMKLATYSPKNIGHYGLALQEYCHFTSPIRRYSDLVSERLLFDEEKHVDLATVAVQCSNQEHLAFRAESWVILTKKFRLLSKDHKNNPKKTYSGLISRVKHFGIFFNLDDYYFENFIPLRFLAKETLLFDSKRLSLRGKHSGKTFTVGKRIFVTIEEIDMIFLEVKWRLVKKQK